MIPDLERWFMMTMNGTRMETINNMLQPEGMQIEMKEFFKNNTTKMGLVIKVQDSAISRIIYPDGSFWLQTDEQIVEEIRSICENYSLSVQNFNSLHKEEILAKVLPKVHSAEHQKIIEQGQYVYTTKFDLLMLYYIPLIRDENGVNTITLSYNIINNAGLSLEEVHKAAMKNLEKDYTIMNLKDIFNIDLPDDGVPKKIVTVPDKVLGAATIFSNRVMQELQNELGEFFAILPSSIHEIIALPLNTYNQLQELLEIVVIINAGSVDPEDKLTDGVYYWDGKLNMYIPEYVGLLPAPEN